MLDDGRGDEQRALGGMGMGMALAGQEQLPCGLWFEAHSCFH